MWLMHPRRGFYSVVAHREDPDILIVRGRVREDLVNLTDLIPHAAKPQMTPSADYPVRIFVSRREWEKACIAMAKEIDWPNFKDEVERCQGQKRHDVYMQVWSALHRLSPPRRFRQRRANWDGGSWAVSDEPR